jgi:polysaccharide biosynthesis transport protein
MQQQQPENQDIREKLKPLRRRWKLIALITVAITALTYYHYRHQIPSYTASTSVFVQSGGQGVAGVDTETDPARRLANAAVFLETPTVADQVAKTLRYSGNPNGLLGMITVTPSADSDFLEITATSPDPKEAAAVANGFADAFVAVTTAQTRAIVDSEEANVQRQLAATPDTPENGASIALLQQQLQTLRLTAATGGVQSVDPAPVPTASTASSPTENAVFAALLGVVLASLLAFAVEAFNRRLRHRMVEAEYGLPLLASIPFSRGGYSGSRAGQLPTTLMEGVRGLRTMLEHGTAGATPRSLLVTSAIPSEGKSTLVKSLGLAYFESAKSVLLIDADLRRPMLHEYFEAPVAPGLSDVLRGSISLADAAQEIQTSDVRPAFDRILAGSASTVQLDNEGERHVGEAPLVKARRAAAPGPVLHLLAAGSGTSDPAALLGSGQLRALLAEAVERYDVVLVDSPPVLSVSDAIPLATVVDAAVVVARSEFTTKDAAQRCRQAFERVSTITVLGVVANAVKETDEAERSDYVMSTS